MNKVTILWLAIIILSGCGVRKNIDNKKQDLAHQCSEEPVEIEGYGDKGKRLTNCFREYPGEPSKKSNDYYVIEDICGQFTKEFMEGVIQKPIVRMEKPRIGGLYNCSYYVDEKSYIMLVLDYLSINNQKIGQEAMGRKVEMAGQIPMRNMVVTQPDGLVNSIYLIFNDNKFISIERSQDWLGSKEDLLELAGRLAKEIKNYK